MRPAEAAGTLLIGLLVLAVAFIPAPAADLTEDDPAASRLDPDYVAGKKAIEAKDWSAAINEDLKQRIAEYRRRVAK